MSADRTDSAGIPFAGRTLPDPGFSGDDGSSDARLAEALEAYARDRSYEQEVLAALTAARVLVPVVAVLGEADTSGALTTEKSADMAVVTLVGRDGRRALPVFTSLASLARWRADARPVPVDGRRAALAAGAEGADAVVVDVAGPAPYALGGRQALAALARGALATPAYDDPALQAHVAAAVAEVLPDARVRLARAEDVDAHVELHVLGDVAPERLQALSERLRDVPRPLVRGLGLVVA